METLKTYRCRVKLGPTYNGRPLRESIKVLNGQTHDFECMWLMGDDEQYPGEYAMMVMDKEVKRTLEGRWVASGDLEELEGL